MVSSGFGAFFADTTGYHPYPYQRTLAEGLYLNPQPSLWPRPPHR